MSMENCGGQTSVALYLFFQNTTHKFELFIFQNTQINKND